MISDELAATIRRHAFADQWSVGAIVRQLGVHRDTVRRVLQAAQAPQAQGAPNPSKLDPFMPFIAETLRQYPTLTAKRLHGMVCERGYVGGSDHFRHRIATLRQRKPAEAYLRLRTLAGEQAQVDWAHFGSLPVPGGARKLYCFVMVLAYSRRIFLEFGFDIGMAGFVRGHVHAFEFFGGLPRVLLYDNLKSAVLERRGDIIRFHPELLALSDHYHYEPRPVAVARGNEKGRVERAIQYIRKGFFAGRTVRDLDELNAEALAWTHSEARSRRWPEDTTCSVEAAYEREKTLLRPAGDQAYPALERRVASVAKTPYARFDGNDYSVPYTAVRSEVLILADERRVRIFDGTAVLAEHPRSYGLHQVVEDPKHIEALRQAKHHAHLHSTQDWLLRTVPEVTPLLQRLAARHGSVGTAVAQLSRLAQSYG
ncbi:MAG: IS21 family transposase, partial [Deltaproteobacteria bacterium]|nr:IS21 family transposase [Deltaproteobacteria bacterium]